MVTRERKKGKGVAIKLSPGQSLLEALCAALGVASLDGWTLADVLGAAGVGHG